MRPIRPGDIVEVHIEDKNPYPGSGPSYCNFVAYYHGPTEHNGKEYILVTPYSDDRPKHWLEKTRKLTLIKSRGNKGFDGLSLSQIVRATKIVPKEKRRMFLEWAYDTDYFQSKVQTKIEIKQEEKPVEVKTEPVVEKKDTLWKLLESLPVISKPISEQPGLGDVITLKFNHKGFNYYRMGAYRGIIDEEIELQSVSPGREIWRESIKGVNVYWMKLI